MTADEQLLLAAQLQPVLFTHRAKPSAWTAQVLADKIAALGWAPVADAWKLQREQLLSLATEVENCMEPAPGETPADSVLLTAERQLLGTIAEQIRQIVNG